MSLTSAGFLNAALHGEVPQGEEKSKRERLEREINAEPGERA